MFSMKSIHTTLIAATLLAGLSGMAMAQSNPETHAGGHRAERMEQMHAKMGERHAKHLAELKAKLKLEPGQEAAWNTFAQSMQPPAKAAAHPDRAALEKLTTPERIDQMQAHRATRDANMKKHGDATKTFYATLNADQKKVFDAETSRGMKKMQGNMRHGGGDHKHHG
jgi:periplasmic protein CpxP/Spy